MKTRMATFLAVVLSSGWARGQVSTVGDVIVVPDPTGSIHQRVMGFGFPGLTPPQGLVCQDASRAALGVLADEYDFFVVFLSEQVSGPSNVPSFQQARLTAQNIGQNPLLNDGAPFGSRAKLKGCAFMGSSLRLPQDPDAIAGDLGSGPLGMKAIEAVGHEIGHAWLVGADYDLGAGGGKMEDLRSGDRHYNPRVDSRSVMFGGCIDPLGGDLFRVSSCPRKYNSMDQYFMGLVSPADVQPLLLAWGQGSNDPLMPLPPTAAPVTIMGSERRVGIDAVIRHMGQRAPAFPATQRCFRTGFIYVARNAPSPEAIVKVDAYRKRFESWFTWASDGHGFVDSRAGGMGCVVPAPDAGVVIDAGSMQVVDGGAEGDAGVVETPDAGSDRMGAPPERIENQQLRPGCGCTSVDPSLALGAVGLLLRRARRRRT